MKNDDFTSDDHRSDQHLPFVAVPSRRLSATITSSREQKSQQSFVLYMSRTPGWIQ